MCSSNSYGYGDNGESLSSHKGLHFQALRLTSMVGFWSCGNDESFLNTCRKKQRFYWHSVTFFGKKSFGQRVPHLKNWAWKKRFDCLLLGFVGALRLCLTVRKVKCFSLWRFSCSQFRKSNFRVSRIPLCVILAPEYFKHFALFEP